MNLADFLRQGPLTQQRMADASAFDRDSELANMMRQHGTVQDPNMVQEPSVLGNLPIDVPQPTQQDMQMGAEQVMNMMPMAGITAWHGSPHKFSKFDMSKIGTGEGAQAYGHGLYMAENPNVAKSYGEALATQKIMGIPSTRHIGADLSRQELEMIKDASDSMRRSLNYAGIEGKGFVPPDFRTYHDYYNFRNDIGYYDDLYMKQNGPQVEQKIVDFENRYSNDPAFKTNFHEFMGKDAKADWGHLRHPYQNAYKNASEAVGRHGGNGNLYKVDIPDDQIAKMLDWDKPLSEQSESVRNALPEALSKRPEMTGAELYNAFSGSGAYKPELNSGFHFAKHGSDTLKEKGIPGIKYLDGGSRSGGQGTSNFVLFADDIAKILERNDQPIGELAEMLSSGKKVKP